MPEHTTTKPPTPKPKKMKNENLLIAIEFLRCLVNNFENADFLYENEIKNDLKKISEFLYKNL